MKDQPLRTSVIGSYPFPAWLEFSAQHLRDFGSSDLAEMQDDAATIAIQDQLGIKFARTPAIQHRYNCIPIDSEQVLKWTEIW